MTAHSRRTAIGSLLSLAVLLTSPRRLLAAAGSCAHCGQAVGCQKTCRLVCEDKKITTTCWASKSEDFCVPGPSLRGNRNCEWVCAGGDQSDGTCQRPQKLVWSDWLPGGWARIYTRKKLLKRTETKTVPSFKWVVEDLCSECQRQATSVSIPSGVEIPPAPSTDAKMLSELPQAATKATK